jgi:hypothetical protein
LASDSAAFAKRCGLHDAYLGIGRSGNQLTRHGALARERDEKTVPLMAERLTHGESGVEHQKALIARSDLRAYLYQWDPEVGLWYVQVFF